MRDTLAGVCFRHALARRPKNPLEVWDYGTGELKETIAWNRSTAQASTGTAYFLSRKLPFFQLLFYFDSGSAMVVKAHLIPSSVSALDV